ncbi:hypothetical protein [Thermocladium modestius]|uniref:hypothetical protein n=1 Tax=Thermocladium modestius TaxID=62609 RepID=UPI00166B923D|nr:hypothetical protein [Thermocladium modestius]
MANPLLIGGLVGIMLVAAMAGAVLVHIYRIVPPPPDIAEFISAPINVTRVVVVNNTVWQYPVNVTVTINGGYFSIADTTANRQYHSWADRCVLCKLLRHRRI